METHGTSIVARQGGGGGGKELARKLGKRIFVNKDIIAAFVSLFATWEREVAARFRVIESPLANNKYPSGAAGASSDADVFTFTGELKKFRSIS